MDEGEEPYEYLADHGFSSPWAGNGGDTLVDYCIQHLGIFADLISIS